MIPRYPPGDGGMLSGMFSTTLQQFNAAEDTRVVSNEELFKLLEIEMDPLAFSRLSLSERNELEAWKKILIFFRSASEVLERYEVVAKERGWARPHFPDPHIVLFGLKERIRGIFMSGLVRGAEISRRQAFTIGREESRIIEEEDGTI